jgi:hypothetical protein
MDVEGNAVAYFKSLFCLITITECTCWGCENHEQSVALIAGIYAEIRTQDLSNITN